MFCCLLMARRKNNSLALREVCILVGSIDDGCGRFMAAGRFGFCCCRWGNGFGEGALPIGLVCIACPLFCD
jgi:hypothetical protein